MFNSSAAVITDTTGAGTIAIRAGHSLLSPNFASSSAVTITDAANLYVNGNVASTNTTITNNWAIYNAGNMRVTGTLYNDAQITAGGTFVRSGNFSRGTWTLGGAVELSAATITDTTGSGTIATKGHLGIGQVTLASNSATTVTDAANLFIAGDVIAGANTTLSNTWGIYNAGKSRIAGQIVAWNATTPGLTVGSLHLGAASATANAGSAITFGARDSSSGSTAQAGIYINSDGGYGTRMYFATSSSYGTGSTTGMWLDESGRLRITRNVTSTSTTTGTLIVTGGTGISENLYVGGTLVQTPATLGSTLGNTSFYQSLRGSNGNSNLLETFMIRDSAGADWTTAGSRIQQKIDSTWMGYMQFNGASTNGGIEWGAGTTTVSAQAITPRMRLDSSGILRLLTNTGSTSTTTGTLVVTGGTGISENLYVGGTAVRFTGNAASSSTSTGTLVVTGGVGVSGNIFAAEHHTATGFANRPGVAYDVTGNYFHAQAGINIGRAAGGTLTFGDGNTPTTIAGTPTTLRAYLNNNAAANQVFYASGVGNLAVGLHTTPQYRLDVNNGVTGSNSFQASFGATFSSGIWSGIHFGYSEAANANYRKSAIVFERSDAGFGDARGKIHILNATAGATSATLADARFTIGPTGNVGISQTNPVAKFEVSGTAGQLLAVTDSMTGTIFAANDASGIPSIEVIDTGLVKLAEYGGFVAYGVSNAVSAAGTTQATATLLTRPINNISTVGANSGVILPSAYPGMRVLVRNATVTTVRVYPGTGAQINTLGTNVQLNLETLANIEFVAFTSTQWYTVNATFA